MIMTLTGQTLGRYQLETLIGRGGMAQVYKAWDPNTQRYVAVKVLHQHLVDDTNFAERFAREGKLIANLHHPNIVALYDFDRQEIPGGGSIHYMVMPLVPGQSLKERLESCIDVDERLSFDEVLRIIDGVAAALDYAHAKDMVHRDIKPGNILFDENGNSLLTDFGLARMTFGARLTESGVASGTPAYMAPEQGLGEPGDHRSDIYSLGIILYEMLTNALPFLADTSLGILMKHINEPLPSPRSIVPSLSPAVEAVIFRATAKDPDSRFQTARAMADELHNALDDGQISARTRAVSSQHGQRPKAPTSLLIRYGPLAAVVVALLVVIGVILANSAPPPTTPAPASTAVSAMTAGPVPFSTDFEADSEYNSGWPQRLDGVYRSEIVDGAYILQSEAPAQAHTAIFSPEYYQYSAMILETNATLLPNSQPDSGYGLVFRYQDEDNYYVFAINGRQQVSIWVRENAAWRELRGGEDDWTVDEAVAPIGESNYLSLLAVGDHFTGYVNGRRVVDVRDATFTRGAVGFYIATTVRNVEQIHTEVSLANFSVTNAVPSMSG